MHNTLDKFSFGKFIKEKREQKGLSLRCLADMMHISPPYLSDIEKGYRAAPLKVINGKDRMADFIKLLSITNDELPKFYELAYATRTNFPDIDEYLATTPKAIAFIKLAMNMNVSDAEWEKFTTSLVDLKDVNHDK